MHSESEAHGETLRQLRHSRRHRLRETRGESPPGEAQGRRTGGGPDRPDRALREAAALAYSNLQDLLDEQGQLLPAKDWPRWAAAAVSSLEVTKRNLVVGDGEQEDVVKIRLWDKTRNPVRPRSERDQRI